METVENTANSYMRADSEMQLTASASDLELALSLLADDCIPFRRIGDRIRLFDLSVEEDDDEFTRILESEFKDFSLKNIPVTPTVDDMLIALRKLSSEQPSSDPDEIVSFSMSCRDVCLLLNCLNEYEYPVILDKGRLRVVDWYTEQGRADIIHFVNKSIEDLFNKINQ